MTITKDRQRPKTDIPHLSFELFNNAEVNL
jgi:hypothetical protein